LTRILGLGEKLEFVGIEEIATDKRGNIYVTEAYKYIIQKFSPTGIPLDEYGKRGNDPENFVLPPYKIICYENVLVVTTKGSSRIQLFTDNFKYIGQISLPGTIVDIIFDHHGHIVAGIIPSDPVEKQILFVLDRSGNILTSASSHKKDDGPAFNMMHISAGINNTIIVGYRFTNTIALYSDELKLIRAFSVPDLPPESPYTIGTSEGIGKIPEGDLIKDIATGSQGNIYILCGDCNNVPNRIVYIFDPEGNYLTRFTLPKKSGILYIDKDGSIYTRENQRTLLSKYKIIFNKKH
jgi:hypothetical protein